MRNMIKLLRPYQLYYVVSVILLLHAMCGRVGRIFLLDDTVYEIYNFCLIAPDGTYSYPTMWFGFVLVAANIALLAGLVLSFTNKLRLQKMLAVCSMLLLAGYYVVYGFCLYSVFMANDDMNVLNLDDVQFFVPFLVLIINLILFFVLKRKEKHLF